MLVVSTWTVSPRVFLAAFFSGTLTVVPSTIFSIPCCTPSPPTSLSWWIPGTAPILSTSSRNMMPCCAFCTSKLASLKQLAHHRLNVLTNIARHGESGAVADGEGNIEALGDGLSQQGLAASG